VQRGSSRGCFVSCSNLYCQKLSPASAFIPCVRDPLPAYSTLVARALVFLRRLTLTS
jgi:hypothetical protein